MTVFEWIVVAALWTWFVWSFGIFNGAWWTYCAMERNELAQRDDDLEALLQTNRAQDCLAAVALAAGRYQQKGTEL